MIMRQRNSKIKPHEHWKFEDNPLVNCNDFVYLGVQLKNNMKWDAAKQRNAEKARKAMYSILSNLRKFGRVDPEIMLKVFDAKVLPILLYGCEI